MNNELESLLIRIRANASEGRYTNEQSVREAIVAPVLRSLGWDDLDPLTVVREYQLAGRRVDYALASTGGKPEVIIEVKTIGQIAGADRQLFEYAFHEGVPFAILTDGQQWHFFLPGEQGDYSERRVYKLDLTEREPLKASEILQRYLGFSRVQSGDALDDARKDYRSAARRRQASEILPKAWSEIVRERDELLLDLIAERAESLCGIRPDAEQVEEFVADHLEGLPSAQQPPDIQSAHGLQDSVRQDARSSARKRISNLKSDASPSEKVPAKASAKIKYEIDGQKYEAKNAKEALLEILKKLSNDDSRFFEKLAPRVRGRNRNHLATDRHDVYPDRPDLAKITTEITPGWWIGLNISNRDKRKIIEGACEVAGIRFGRGLKINLPNA